LICCCSSLAMTISL